MSSNFQNSLLTAANIIEKQIDKKIDELDNLKDEDLVEIRKKRMEEMKLQQKKKEEYLSLGHGQYQELADVRDFFEVCKKSQNLVCHFYRDSTIYCQTLDKYLEILARKHLSTKFTKINAERSEFLVERLRIKVMPTICLIKDGKAVDYIVGLDDVGGKDVNVDSLEWRISKAGLVEFHGDMPLSKKTQKTVVQKKTIKSNSQDSDEDE